MQIEGLLKNHRSNRFPGNSGEQKLKNPLDDFFRIPQNKWSNFSSAFALNILNYKKKAN